MVLRNYIAQNAIEAAERGDFSEVRGPECNIKILREKFFFCSVVLHYFKSFQVQRVLKVLENPYSISPDLESPVWSAGSELDQADFNSIKRQEVMENTQRKAAADPHRIPYNSKPPAWARVVCVT